MPDENGRATFVADTPENKTSERAEFRAWTEPPTTQETTPEPPAETKPNVVPQVN